MMLNEKLNKIEENIMWIKCIIIGVIIIVVFIGIIGGVIVIMYSLL